MRMSFTILHIVASTKGLNPRCNTLRNVAYSMKKQELSAQHAYLCLIPRLKTENAREAKKGEGPFKGGL